MKNKYLALSVAISIITSCSSHDGESSKLDLSCGKKVSIDSITTPCTFAPAAMTIIGNELFVANIRQDTVFNVFELPSLKYVRSGGIAGPGPGAISGGTLALATTKFNDKFLSLIDVSGLGINIIEPVELKATEHEIFFSPADWNYIQNYSFLSDGRQLLQRGHMPMDWGIVNEDYEIETSFEQQLPDDVISWADSDMNKMLIRSAHCAVSEKNNAIAIVSSCLPIIDLYDFEGNLKRRIIGEYALGDRIAKTAIYIQSTDDHIFVNYHDPADTNNTHSTIAVFDWDGKQVETYQVGILVTTFAVDEVNKKIYFTTDKDNDNLFWFDI